ncbi:unnamed protein product, partial [marine sediment metagenome]
RQYLETVALIDCHDHTDSEGGCSYNDPMQVVANSYFLHDLTSASSEQEVAIMQDTTLSIDERWPIFERAWKRTCHTGYAQVIRRALKRFYGYDEPTLDGLKALKDKLLDVRNPEVVEGILEEAKIVARITDIDVGVKSVLDGSAKLPPRARIVIQLPSFHSVADFPGVQEKAAAVGRHVTSLDEYLEVCRSIFEGYKKFGAVAFKDQSAYTRTLEYGNPTRAQAEEVFNWFVEDPRRRASYPDGVKPLDDYLFHEFMRMARDLDLP